MGLLTEVSSRITSIWQGIRGMNAQPQRGGVVTQEVIDRTPEQLADEVFELLKRRGPMLAAQICVELLLSPKAVESALRILEDGGAVEQRTGEESSVDTQGLPVWGLPTWRWRSRHRRAS